MSFNASLPMSVPASGSRVMLTRDALYPLWGSTTVDDPTSTASVSYSVSYLCASTGPINAAANREDINSTVLDLCGIRNQKGDFLGSLTTNDSSVKQSFPGTYNAIIARDNSDVPWIYVPEGAHVGVSTNGNNFSVAWDAYVDLEVWTSPGEAQYYTRVTLAGNAGVSAVGPVFTPPQARWIRPTNLAIATGSGTANAWTPIIAIDVFCTNGAPTYTAGASVGTWAAPVAANTKTYFMPASTSIEWNVSKLPWSATRLNAVAAVFTNTTKVLNKEGTVLWGRLNPSLTNPFDATITDVETLHPSEKRYLPLETGCYAYNPPSTDLARFTTYIQRAGISGVSVQVPVYRLDNDAFVEMGFFSDPDGGTSLAVNLDYHIEFRTNSTLFDIGVSSVSLEALHMAQVHLLKAGFFFKNDEHVGYLTRFISGMAKLHPFLSVMSPIAGGILKATSVAMSRSTRGSRPPPTSATSSGITRSPGTQPKQRRRGRRRAKTLPPSGPASRNAALNRAMAQQNNAPFRARQGSVQLSAVRLPSRMR